MATHADADFGNEVDNTETNTDSYSDTESLHGSKKKKKNKDKKKKDKKKKPNELKNLPDDEKNKDFAKKISDFGYGLGKILLWRIITGIIMLYFLKVKTGESLLKYKETSMFTIILIVLFPEPWIIIHIIMGRVTIDY